MDSSCYLFPELLHAKTGRGSRAAACEFRRTALSPAPGARAAAPRGMQRAGMPEGGIEDLEHQAYCRGFDDGARSGYAQGEKAGSEAVRQRLEHGLNTCDAMLQELENLRRKFQAEIETELVQLALAVARKIVNRELGIAPETVTATVRQALDRVEHADRITIRLNPEDLKLLSEISPTLMAGRPDAGRAVLEADEGMTRGGCLIETDSGEVDARIERQFQVIEEAFRAELEGGRTPGGVGR
ncbi:MAG: FliH/SctL family protein [Desulfobacterales bacterium]